VVETQSTGPLVVVLDTQASELGQRLLTRCEKHSVADVFLAKKLFSIIVKNPQSKPLKSINELTRENEPGYPRSIYDDSKVMLQHWKRGGANELILVITKDSYTENEKRLYWDCQNDQPSIYLNVPQNVINGIVAALRSCSADLEREIVVLKECLAVILEDETAQGIGELLEQTGINFNADIYGEFQKAHAEDMKTLNEMYYKSLPFRPIHPNISVLEQELKKIETQIDAVDLDSDDYDECQKRVEFLADKHGYMFEKCHILLEEITNESGSKEEDKARSEIERRTEKLLKKKHSKLADFE
jgi:hypothetical protein